MKTTIFVGLGLTAWTCLAPAQVNQPKTSPPAPPPPPPVSATAPSPGSPERFTYEQKPVAGRPFLVTPEQAQTIINRFKETYAKLGSPRVLVFVNRDLVDQQSGTKLSARHEETESVRGDVKALSDGGPRASAHPPTANAPRIEGAPGDLNTATKDLAAGKGGIAGQVEKVSAKNTYRVREQTSLTLADKQTIRDVERMFGRPLRMAGVSLVDQGVATQLIADRPIGQGTAQTEGEQARKDREALGKIAEVVLEVLVVNKQMTVTELSGDKVYLVPDIQVTAIRLKDSRILGQASSSDFLGQGAAAGRSARQFGVREITEATALAIMEDMTP